MKYRTGIWIGVGAAVLALAAVPFLLPLDTYKPAIERAASAALGRTVQIRGPMHLAVYPQLGISLSDVTVANMPGGREPELASIGSVLVGAELMPLFSRRLEVTEVVLQKPVIHLEIDKDGNANWAIAKPPAKKAGDAAPAAAPAQGFGFRTVSVTGGELSYFDARTNGSEKFQDIAIDLNLQPGANRQQPLAAPLTVKGQVTYNAEPLKIDGRIDRFASVLNGQPTGLHLGISSNIINADFTGSVGSEGRISGALKMGAHSVRSFAAWAGHPMPPGNGFGLMAMEGQFTATGGVYTLSHTHLAFDSMNLNADMSLDTNAQPLAIKGVITIDRFDVNPYLAPGKEADSFKAAKAKTVAGPETPLELGWLKAANADLKLVLGGLQMPNFKLDHAIADIALKDGVLKADFTNVTAYGGTGKGNLLLDASKNVPALRETMDIDGVKAQPLLTDLIGVNRVSGTGAMRLDLSTRGTSEAAMVKGLNGKGSVTFSDGAIAGVDLAAVSRVLQSTLTAQVLTGAVGNDAKTTFGRMGGTFTVQDGVLRTNDLKLTNEVAEINAKGTADLTTRTLDFRIDPRAKRGIPGLKLVDIGVPFYAKGPWENPNYSPDAVGIAKSVVNKLGEDATIPADLVKDPAGALKSLFGGK